MFTDGQKIAKKLLFQISKETKSLQSLLQKYNACESDEAASDLTIAEALDPANIEERLKTFGCLYAAVATGRKRQIIDAYLRLCRSNEELSMLKEDTSNMCIYYEERKKCITDELRDQSNSDSFSRGARAMLHQLLGCIERHLQDSYEVKDLLNKDTEDISSHLDEDSYSDFSDNDD